VKISKKKRKKTLKNVENETQTLYKLICSKKTVKNMEKEKCSVWDLEYGEKQ